MIIVQATLADVADIVALVNGAYRGETAEASWTHEAALIDGQRTDAATLAAEMQAGATILVGRVPGEIAPVGCVLLEPGEAPDERVLGMLTVTPRRQTNGVGRQLLQAAEHLAWEQRARRIVLKVIHLRAPLIAWYERRGYRRSGVTAPFPYGDARFGLPRRPDLHFVVLDKSRP